MKSISHLHPVDHDDVVEINNHCVQAKWLAEAWGARFFDSRRMNLLSNYRNNIIRTKEKRRIIKEVWREQLFPRIRAD